MVTRAGVRGLGGMGAALLVLLLAPARSLAQGAQESETRFAAALRLVATLATALNAHDAGAATALFAEGATVEDEAFSKSPAPVPAPAWVAALVADGVGVAYPVGPPADRPDDIAPYPVLRVHPHPEYDEIIWIVMVGVDSYRRAGHAARPITFRIAGEAGKIRAMSALSGSTAARALAPRRTDTEAARSLVPAGPTLSTQHRSASAAGMSAAWPLGLAGMAGVASVVLLTRRRTRRP